MQFTRGAINDWRKLDDKKREYYQKIYEFRMRQR